MRGREVRERLEGTTRDIGDLVRGLNFPQLVRHGVEMMLENGLSGDERHAIRVRRDEKRLDVGAEAGAAEHDDARDGPCREGGGKGPGHGKHGRAKRAPDSAPGSWRAPCARPYTPKGQNCALTSNPEARAQCGRSARSDPCGGRPKSTTRAVPTAIPERPAVTPRPTNVATTLLSPIPMDLRWYAGYVADLRQTLHAWRQSN